MLSFILGRYTAVLSKVYHLTTGHISRKKKKRNIIQKDINKMTIVNIKKKKKDICTPKFNAALFTIARTGRQPKCSTTEEWLQTTWYIYTGILLSHKEECNCVICRKVDGPKCVIQNEVSQKERNKNCILMHIYGI